jgi:hypothetical protein
MAVFPAQGASTVRPHRAARRVETFGDVPALRIRRLDRAARAREDHGRLRRRQLLSASDNTRGQMAVFITKAFNLQ